MPPRLLALAVAGCLAGCSSEPPPPAEPPDARRVTAEEVSALLLLPPRDGPRPRGAGDLRKYENAYPVGFAAVRSGAFVVSWGADPAGDPEAVLAHEKDAPAGGGWVVFRSGTVKRLTAEEFAAAPKAK